jgi:Protein of unknown function (DUF1565)
MLARTRWALLTAGSLGAAWAVYACASNPSGACDENGTCPGADDGGGDASQVDVEPGEGGETADGGVDATADAGDGGTDGDGSAGDGGDGSLADESVCDPTRTPAEDPCVIDELYGVFVSPTGADTNLGTRAAPVRTITKAMALAHGPMQRVYACAGTYAENLAVSASNNAASVYGGLDCTTWAYDPTHDKVRVAPTQVGYALAVTGTSSVTVTALFEDVELDAPPASSNSPAQPNSVGVFAYLAQLMLQRVVVVAGSALSGTAGASGGTARDPSNLIVPPAMLDGNPPAPMGAPAILCTCPDDRTMPGVISSVGGQGSAVAVDAGPGLPSYGEDAGAGNPGPNGVSCGTGGTGQNGADGPRLPAGISNLSRGTLSAGGWVPSAGAAGSNGQAGQGGGGGGNGLVNTGMGGGGACGGCGGAGGMPGMGGGSSIALLSLDAMVSLVGCTLTADNAGSGGPGGNGESGQAGGGGATGSGGGVAAMAGCPGGPGGAGAGGNGGQGGPGGLSLGIGYGGIAPTIDGVPVSPVTAAAGVQVGNAGTGGAGGMGGPSATSNLGHPGTPGARGIDGVAQAVSSF